MSEATGMGRLTWRIAAGALALLCACADARAEGFDDWRADFARRAKDRGFSETSIAAVLSDLKADDKVVSNDQAQVTKPPTLTDYLESRLTQRRLADMRRFIADNGEMLKAVEARYGVSAEAIVTVWSLETNLGRTPLSFDARQSIATLAFDGRRRDLFEGHLFALIEMVDRGYARADELRSSWDGGLGQPQFMPTTYLKAAVDWDGDGRRDIWSNTGDAAASIANYLIMEGWRPGEPVLVQVKHPKDADLAPFTEGMHALEQLNAAGLRRSDGQPWGPQQTALKARLYRPFGVSGPHFLAFHNFEAMRRYNGSARYGLTAAVMVNTLQGGPRLPAPLRFTDPALTRRQITELQSLLSALGYKPGKSDGDYGPGTHAAAQAFAKAEGFSIGSTPRASLLEAARGKRR